MTNYPLKERSNRTKMEIKHIEMLRKIDIAERKVIRLVYSKETMLANYMCAY